MPSFFHSVRGERGALAKEAVGPGRAGRRAPQGIPGEKLPSPTMGQSVFIEVIRVLKFVTGTVAESQGSSGRLSKAHFAVVRLRVGFGMHRAGWLFSSHWLRTKVTYGNSRNKVNTLTKGEFATCEGNSALISRD